jgi:hypothetical protein
VHTPLKMSLSMGFVCTAGGAVVSVRLAAVGEGFGTFVFGAPVAGFSSGQPFGGWSWLVPGVTAPLLGTLCGALTGAVAHCTSTDHPIKSQRLPRALLYLRRK